MSFHLQAIITVTFEVPGNIKEENLHLFIQVSHISLLTQKKSLGLFIETCPMPLCLWKQLFLFIESSVGEECER